MHILDILPCYLCCERLSEVRVLSSIQEVTTFCPFSFPLSFLLSCMALLFTEIVNQLNALSCLHGDDDDAGDGGFLKQARKAAAKPAASSQGLCSSFFHLLPCSRLFWASPPLHFCSFPRIFVFLNPFIFQLYPHLPSPLFCDGVKIHQWCAPCGDVLCNMWECQLVFILLRVFFFWQLYGLPVLTLQPVVNQTI